MNDHHTKWKKTIIKTFRVSEPDLKRLNDACRAENMPLSQYVRQATLLAMRNKRKRVVA